MRNVRLTWLNMSFEAPRIRLRNVMVAYAYSFAGWGAFALLMASQEYIVARSMNPKTKFLEVLLVPLIRGTATALLTPVLYFFVLKWPFSGKRLWLSTLRYLSMLAGFMVAFTTLRWLMFPGWDYVNKRWLPRSFDSLLGFAVGGYADQIILFLIMVIAAHAWAFDRYSRLQTLKQSNLQRELAELQLQLLQMQLHPHFIFNTLHGITTLMERDVDTARTMLLHLADLLRAAISSQSQDLIQLRQELTFVSSYVALEQMRLGSRLEVNFKVEDAANDALVPYMVLQPIVENAILHGAATSRKGGWVNIGCRIEQRSVVLEVENTAAPAPEHESNGLGLRNTRARLQNLFEQEADLDFAVHNGTACTRIRLPLITAREAVAQ
jgi:two-component system, LytTR family, sensor kinase